MQSNGIQHFAIRSVPYHRSPPPTRRPYAAFRIDRQSIGDPFTSGGMVKDFSVLDCSGSAVVIKLKNVARSRASPKKRFQIGREPHAVRAARPGKQLGNRSIHIHTIQAALWMLTERPGEDTAFRVGNDIIETIHAILRELSERGDALIQLQVGDILDAE